MTEIARRNVANAVKGALAAGLRENAVLATAGKACREFQHDQQQQKLLAEFRAILDRMMDFPMSQGFIAVEVAQARSRWIDRHEDEDEDEREVL